MHFREQSVLGVALRAGLLRAIIERHRPVAEVRRHELLDAYDGLGRDALHALAGALVVPLADALARPGGPGFLQVSSDLVNRPHPAIDPASLDDHLAGLGQLSELVGQVNEEAGASDS